MITKCVLRNNRIQDSKLFSSFNLCSLCLRYIDHRTYIVGIVEHSFLQPNNAPINTIASKIHKTFKALLFQCILRHYQWFWWFAGVCVCMLGVWPSLSPIPVVVPYSTGKPLPFNWIRLKIENLHNNSINNNNSNITCTALLVLYTH